MKSVGIPELKQNLPRLRTAMRKAQENRAGLSLFGGVTLKGSPSSYSLQCDPCMHELALPCGCRHLQQMALGQAQRVRPEALEGRWASCGPRQRPSTGSSGGWATCPLRRLRVSQRLDEQGKSSTSVTLPARQRRWWCRLRRRRLRTRPPPIGQRVFLRPIGHLSAFATALDGRGQRV